MTRKCVILFCDNEHGTGDVTFPDLIKLDGYQLQEQFIQETTLAEVRRAAKAAGWGRVNGGDYCPGCMDSMKD